MRYAMAGQCAGRVVEGPVRGRLSKHGLYVGREVDASGVVLIFGPGGCRGAVRAVVALRADGVPLAAAGGVDVEAGAAAPLVSDAEQVLCVEAEVRVAPSLVGWGGEGSFAVAQVAQCEVGGAVGFIPRFQVSVPVVCDEKATVRAGVGRQPGAWSAGNGAIVAVAVDAANRGVGRELPEAAAGEALLPSGGGVLC